MDAELLVILIYYSLSKDKMATFAAKCIIDA